MGVRVRTELVGSNMELICANKNIRLPLGAEYPWASIVVDDKSQIIPWSVIFSCFLVGSYFITCELGQVKLQDGVVLNNCLLRVIVSPDFKDTKYNRWRLFDVQEVS